ncbi:DUF2585 domain-containing protein [Roseomonas sp. CAU 1739]|uniref:DUF2585 domain-containing protein n=1 Tax=Roseomonas sp. CAU 1739 TaxID=3140364 RepID=UPI00325A55BD
MTARWMPWAAMAGILVAVAGIEFALGRVPICTCGYVSLWHGDVWSSGNSQHLTDWYTLSHLVHGFIFYAALRWLAPRWSVPWRAVAAMLLEGAWEVLENTSLIIDRYREVTASLDYYGDSIVNSISDGVAMLVGFFVASRLPTVASILVVLMLEGVAAWAIRDNLTLNVLMLVRPVDAVRAWQTQAAPSPR